jgi:peptidoglycan/xylan/chitin deacetylase (PgdA/CDA1 family)
MGLLHRYARRAYSHASLACLIVGAGVAAFVLRPGPAGQRGAAAAERPAAKKPPALLFGVRRELLYRGHEEAMAAKSEYLGDPARLAVTRALDERREAWELRGLHYRHLAWGPAGRKEVLLTFDDGPNPETTPQVLDILKRENVPAAFFLVGRWVASYPDLVRREAAEGHALGNHTWHHAYLTRMEPECARAQIEATTNAIEAVTGVRTRWFRPPGGHYDPQVVRLCNELGQVIVLWSDTPGDWLHPTPQAIEARGLRYLKPGAIILLHDTLPETVTMLPDFIHQVRARGYQFVPLSRFTPYIHGGKG